MACKLIGITRLLMAPAVYPAAAIPARAPTQRPAPQHKSPLVAQALLPAHFAPFPLAWMHDRAVRTSKPRAAPSLPAPQHNDSAPQHESPLVAQALLPA